ncbi:phasin family protein [Micromonospora fluostatini]|uniref:phasin family protein n=1 Tax=Micromonospora sp. JCM 30529 TaxID=3421643 RepID=UPI003D17D86C
MQDAWRAYLELAMGLTEAPRKRAQDVARRLVGSGGATAAQLQALAEELVSTGAANREALTKLVRFEVDRALGAVGLATADEVAELTRRVHELERQLREARTGGPAVAPDTAPEAFPTEPSPVAASARAGESGAADSGPAAAEPAAGQAGAGAPAAPPEGAVARKAVAKKAVAKKAVKKALVKKEPAEVTPVRDEEEAGGPASRPVPGAPARRQPTDGDA